MTKQQKEILFKLTTDYVNLLKSNRLFTSPEISFNMNDDALSVKISNSSVSDDDNLILSKRYGFTQNIVGMTFEDKGGNHHKIISFKTINRKLPIISQHLNTVKSYKWTPLIIKSYLGGDKLVNRNANLENFFK